MPLSKSVLSWCQCYKTFYGRKLGFLVISWSAHPLQAFPV